MTVKWATEPRRLKPGQLVCFFGEFTFNPDFWASDDPTMYKTHRCARPRELFLVLSTRGTARFQVVESQGVVGFLSYALWDWKVIT